MLSKQAMQSVLEYAPDAMLVLDEAGVILFANRQACLLFGFAASELQGESVELLIPERFRLQHIGHRIQFGDDRRIRAMGGGRELLGLSKDGSELSLEISLGPVRVGLWTIVVVSIRNASLRPRTCSHAADSAPAPRVGQAPARILVVEDERVVAMDLQQTLRALGHDAYATAGSGAAALVLAAAGPPELVLMDIRIDGATDGIDIATELRERFGTSVIFLTAHADDLTLERAKRVLPCGYLIKPTTSTAIKAAVEMALARRALRPLRAVCR